MGFALRITGMGEGAHALTLLRRVKDHGDGLRPPLRVSVLMHVNSSIFVCARARTS